MNKTAYEQILPISFETLDFEPELLKSAKVLKDLVNQFTYKQEISNLQERNTIKDLGMANYNFLFDNHTVDIFPHCSCYYFIIGYCSGFIYNMQTFYSKYRK